jgi:predicted translin family RNA/ssDNA-binding protein
MSDFIYLCLGFGFGVMFMLNHKDWRNQKTYEQLDAELRDELSVNKNLVKSLKEDLIRAKQRIQTLKGQK